MLRTVVVIFTVLFAPYCILNYCIQLFGYPAASVLLNSVLHSHSAFIGRQEDLVPDFCDIVLYPILLCPLLSFLLYPILDCPIQSYRVLFLSCLCIRRQEDPVPDFCDIIRLSQGCPTGSTLMWAVVDSGDVTFFAFHPVSLPVDADIANM